MENYIVKNGIYHILVKDKKDFDCTLCSLYEECSLKIFSDLCADIFEKINYHFEIKEDGKTKVEERKS